MSENLPAKKEQPQIVEAAASAWGISPEAVIPFMLKTVVSGTRNYKPTASDCIHVLIAAMNYNLNPFTKEIYGFVDRDKIIPVVGVDGWSRIVNSRGNFDGASFKIESDPNGKPVSCTCKIHCKDRAHPVEVTEYFDECYVAPRGGRDGPWQTHPRRMLRHKAFIQAARYAFALTGIYDPDEAERIVGGPLNVTDVTPAPSPEPDTTPDPLLIEAMGGNDGEAIEVPEHPTADEIYQQEREAMEAQHGS